MKTPLVIGLAIIATLATLSARDPKIIPGKAIGSVTLGEKLVDVERQLGRSSDGDVSMGRLTETWKTKDGGILEVFCKRLDEHTFIVWKVRTTSQAFSLLDDIRVGNQLEDIRKAFPSATLTADKPNLRLEDTKKGIAFELNGEQAKSPCTAVSVFMPQ
jgi:hypothetical protein